MTKELPKSLSCRLGEPDTDIREDLAKFDDCKTERIKAVYRMGLAYEAMQADSNLIPDKQTVAFYRLAIQDVNRKNNPELPTPVLYTSQG
jgi:hypothetical protein